MLTTEPKMISIFSAHSPPSLHIFFWGQFLDSHLTTYHLNIGVQIIAVFDLGMSTLKGTSLRK